MNDNWLSRVGHCAALSWLHVVEGKLYVSQKKNVCYVDKKIGWELFPGRTPHGQGSIFH